MSFDPTPLLSAELDISQEQIRKVLALLADNCTVPFIARYRKEATGNLDEVQIRAIQERRTYLVDLEDRRTTILESIQSQGKLTDELKKSLLMATTKTELEDLYLPYKPKRRTKAQIAKEKGLEPLAEKILAQALSGNPEQDALSFICEEKGVSTAAAALEGARHIVAEQISDRADVRAFIRDLFATEGVMVSKVTTEYKDKPTKWNQYYDFNEPVRKIPSHRFLAIRRGEKEGVLTAEITIDNEKGIHEICRLSGLKNNSPYGKELLSSIEDSYKRLLKNSIEMDLFVDLKMRSDEEAIRIFAENLDTLLLASPLGDKTVIGIDPGLRTGCKCAALSSTGKFLETVTFNLTASSEREKKILQAFALKHKPYAIAIGNGTASRETELFVKGALKEVGLTDILVVQVSEAGASVYSASDVAREEFPDLDLTVRGAISIARRLQDPLAELVKVEPKSIGVGQYQHDVYQPLLERKLHEVVESCVNRVGVELNTASFSILSYVAGIGSSLAKKIVSYRDLHGAFQDRKELLEVPGLGPRTFEQAAGFLRIRNGKNPLDRSAVHPERYPAVAKILKDIGQGIEEVLGNPSLIQSIDKKKYISAELGELTLNDIIDELKKPGRDPRKTFEAPAFRADVSTMKDLTVGMVLEGIVTNVTAFGAFVDIGVHQDGLVHISELSEQFIRSPSEAVSTGDKIKVQVLEVDLGLKRISLTARVGKPPRGKAGAAPASKGHTQPQPQKQRQRESFGSSPFASL